MKKTNHTTIIDVATRTLKNNKGERYSRVP